MSDKAEVDDAGLNTFTNDLLKGIPFKKLTNKASNPVQRVLIVNSAVSTLNYRFPESKDEGHGGCCKSLQSRKSNRPDLSLAMLMAPKGVDLKNGNYAIKLQAQSAKIKILCTQKNEYDYLMKGLNLLYEAKSSKETVGQMDPRNTSVGSMADLYKITGYTPASFTSVKSNGEKVTYNICCGYSWEDMGYFTCFFLSLWSFVLGFYGLLLKAALDTDENHVALWFYFVFFCLSVSLVTMSINVAQRTMKEKEAKLKEKEIQV